MLAKDAQVVPMNFWVSKQVDNYPTTHTNIGKSQMADINEFLQLSEFS